MITGIILLCIKFVVIMLKPPNNVYFKVYLYELAQPRIQTVHFGIDLSDLARSGTKRPGSDKTTALG